MKLTAAQIAQLYQIASAYGAPIEVEQATGSILKGALSVDAPGYSVLMGTDGKVTEPAR